LKKIEEMKSAGTTLLFVSHVPAQAEAVCERAIWLEGGRIREDGPASQVVRHYSESIVKRLCADGPSNVSLEVIALVPQVRLGNGEIRIRSVYLQNGLGERVSSFYHGEPWEIVVTADVFERVEKATLIFELDLPNRAVVKSYTHHKWGPLSLTPGSYVFKLRFPSMRLYEGTYYVSIGFVPSDIASHMDDSKIYDGFVHILSFSVKSRGGSRFSTRALDLGASVEIKPIPS
jgi:lipopolysaccharide transport system ATP-binding protein